MGFCEHLEAIERLLGQGLIELGDVTSGGFVGGSAPSTVVLERLQEEWAALGRDLLPGDCLIANTPRGYRQARNLKGKS